MRYYGNNKYQLKFQYYSANNKLISENTLIEFFWRTNLHKMVILPLTTRSKTNHNMIIFRQDWRETNKRVAILCQRLTRHLSRSSDKRGGDKADKGGWVAVLVAMDFALMVYWLEN